MSTSGSFCAELRALSDPAWRELLEHPFIRELADGTLPLEKFRFFVEQDLLYLPQFARCNAMGAAKSSTDAQLRYFAAELAAVLDEEIPNSHRLLARLSQLGAEDRGDGAMAPGNVGYTNHLLAVAGWGGPLDIMAAILPCSWSYAEIASRLAPTAAEHPIYRDWISFYLSEESQQRVKKMRDDFDAMVDEDRAGVRERARLAEIFDRSSRLEVAFWDMAYILQRSEGR